MVCWKYHAGNFRMQIFTFQIFDTALHLYFNFNPLKISHYAVLNIKLYGLNFRVLIAMVPFYWGVIFDLRVSIRLI